MDRIYQILITAVLALGVGVFAGILGTRMAENVSIDWPASIKSVSELRGLLSLPHGYSWACNARQEVLGARVLHEIRVAFPA
jgi:hypothetical protein